MPPAVEALIVSLRRSHPGWGPRTLLAKLKAQLYALCPALARLLCRSFRPGSRIDVAVAGSMRGNGLADGNFPHYPLEEGGCGDGRRNCHGCNGGSRE